MKDFNKLNDQDLEAVSGGITEEEAIKTAMAKAGLNSVDFHTIHQDREHGVKVYEIKLIKGGMEYEFDIDCRTGEILDFDRDFCD